MQRSWRGTLLGRVAMAIASVFSPSTQTVVAQPAASGMYPVLLFVALGLAASVALLLSGWLTVPLESW